MREVPKNADICYWPGAHNRTDRYRLFLRRTMSLLPVIHTIGSGPRLVNTTIDSYKLDKNCFVFYGQLTSIKVRGHRYTAHALTHRPSYLSNPASGRCLP